MRHPEPPPARVLATAALGVPSLVPSCVLQHISCVLAPCSCDLPSPLRRPFSWTCSRHDLSVLTHLCSLSKAGSERVEQALTYGAARRKAGPTLLPCFSKADPGSFVSKCWPGAALAFGATRSEAGPTLLPHLRDNWCTLTHPTCFGSPGRERVEQSLAFGATRREAGRAVVKAGAHAALECLMSYAGGPGLLLLPALAAGLLLAGVPPLLVRDTADGCEEFLTDSASQLASVP